MGEVLAQAGNGEPRGNARGAGHGGWYEFARER